MTTSEGIVSYLSINTEAQLLKVLGNAPPVQTFIRTVDNILYQHSVVHGKEGKIYRRKKDTLKQLNFLANQADLLVNSLSEILPVSLTEQPHPDEIYATLGKINISSLTMLLASLNGDSHAAETLPTLIRLQDDLNHLSATSKSAAAYLSNQEARGDSTPSEKSQQTLEQNILNAYISNFGCYPAKTGNGAFSQSMKLFYGAIGLPSSNTPQRISKAIDRHKSNLTREKVTALKTIPRLHPINKED